MRTLFVWMFLAGTAFSQELIGPRLVVMPSDCNDDFTDGTAERSIVIATTGATRQFTAFAHPNRWLRVAPLNGTVGPGGTTLNLTVDERFTNRGTQRTYLAIALHSQGSTTEYVISVEVTCVPSPTLIVSEQEFNLSLVQGGPPGTASFLVEANQAINAPIQFDIIRDTPGYSTSWITSAAQIGQPPDRGVVPDNNTPATVTFRVDPRTLTAGTYLGYVHVRDRNAAEGGTDTVQVNVQVSAPPSTLDVRQDTLVFASQAMTVTPASRTLPVRATGSALQFTARPVTSLGGSWLLVNGGTTASNLTTPSDLTISIANNTLAPGTYSGFIQLTPASGTAMQIPVQLTVTAVAVDERPAVNQNGVREAAGGAIAISPGSWASIYGSRLAPDTPQGRTWTNSEIVNNRLPATLDGVSVTIGGRPASMYFVSSDQLNVQVPSDAPLGSNVPVIVTTSRGTSQSALANVQQYAPGFFLYLGTRYVAAQHANFTLVARGNLFPGANVSPARPGEVVILYATGFGPTDPPTQSGVVLPAGPRVTTPLTVRIGGITADAQGFLSGAGLYQLNVTIPAALPDGDHQVVAEIGGFRTQDNVLITVVR
jgi:uncharacterized protein (TIGR03437 family)